MHVNVRAKNVLTKKGHVAPDMFLLYTPKGVAFQSHSVIVAFKDNVGQVYLDEQHWRNWPPVSEYRASFLKETTEVTVEKIAKGEYKLVDLNKDEDFPCSY